MYIIIIMLIMKVTMLADLHLIVPVMTFIVCCVYIIIMLMMVVTMLAELCCNDIHSMC